MPSRYKYDKTIKVGDYIRAYHKGIHRVVEIENRGRGTASPLFYYEKVLTHHWQPAKGKIKNCCDAGWCEKITRKSISMEAEELRKHYEEAADLLFGKEQIDEEVGDLCS